MGQDNTNHSQPIKVAALTAGVNIPSSRFRIRQYISRLSRQGIAVREHIPFFEKSCGLPSPFKMGARIPALLRSRDADIVWVGKELVQGYETFERLLKRPRMIDIDDAIWLSWPLGRFAAADIARVMDAVVVGNNYLADYFSRYCKTIYVVPTAIDLNRYQLRPGLAGEPPKKFVIGWTGLACNYKYLKPIESVLQQFILKHKQAELVLISDRPWKHRLLPPDKVKFVLWSEENEATALHSLSVGIMPLKDDKWTRGKCSFKMLQYMAVGLPVIVSPVGLNRDILQKADIGFGAASPDEWYDALKSLYGDWSLQVKLGRMGRNVVERFYNADIIAIELARIFKKLVAC